VVAIGNVTTDATASADGYAFAADV